MFKISFLPRVLDWVLVKVRLVQVLEEECPTNRWQVAAEFPGS